MLLFYAVMKYIIDDQVYPEYSSIFVKNFVVAYFNVINKY